MVLEIFGGIGFGTIHEQVERFVAAQHHELGTLSGQFIDPHDYGSDLIEPLAAYLYHRGDLTPERLEHLDQIMLHDLAEQFYKTVDNMQQASANYIYRTHTDGLD